MRPAERVISKELELLIQKGFSRVYKDGELFYIEDLLQENAKWISKSIGELTANDIYVLVDRFTADKDEDNLKRIADSVQTSFDEGSGELMLLLESSEKVEFNNKFEMDGISFLEPSHQLFNYNNPYGACKTCEGYGKIIGIDPYKVIP